MNKTYSYFDTRTNRNVTLTRVETKCQCLGCFFLDEDTGDCLSPMPIDLGDDCMDEIDGRFAHFQFRDAEQDNVN